MLVLPVALAAADEILLAPLAIMSACSGAVSMSG
jgi:hypothetical protein